MGVKVTCTAWVQFLTICDDSRGQKHIDSGKSLSLSLNDLNTACRHYVGVSFITSLKSNLCTALTTQNTTGKNCIISGAQNTTALQNNVFTSATGRSNGRVGFLQRKPLAKVN